MECTYQPPTKISIGEHILSRDDYHDLYDRSCSCSQLYHQAKRSHLALLVELDRADSWCVPDGCLSPPLFYAECLTDQQPSLCVASLPSEHFSPAKIGRFGF